MKHLIPSLYIDDRIAIGAFDFDGNILAPETPIYVLDRMSGEEIAIAGHELDKHPELISGPNAPYRWHDDIIDSLIHFRDYHSDPRHGGPDRLKSDIEHAISRGALAPSFKSLKELFLIPARFLTIITSRGHGPDNLARILWIINDMLLSKEEKEEQNTNINALYSVFENNTTELSYTQALRYYFEQIVTYYPVSNPHVAKYLSMSGVSSPSERKSIAMRHALAYVESRYLSHPALSPDALTLGFSDDSVSNILSMLNLFRELKSKDSTSRYHFHLYFTGKKEDYALLKKMVDISIEQQDMLMLKI